MYSLNPEEYNPFLNKKKGSHYTQEQLNFIKELIDLGWSVNRITKTYGLDSGAIKERVKNNNWICAEKNRNIYLSNQDLQEIKTLVENGVSYEDICNKFSIAENSLLNRIINNKWERGKRNNTYTFNEYYFDNIDNEHKAYWLGFLYADGYILSKRNCPNKVNEQQSFGFSISAEDSELFEKFKKDLNANNPVHYYKNYSSSFTSTKNSGRILLTSQHTVNSLKKLGLVENKTFFLKEPPIDKKWLPAFLRGYSDGDGSVYICQNGKFGWSILGTKEFLTFIQKFLGTQVKLSQRFPERDNNNYTLTYTGNVQVPKLLDNIYDNATIYLTRKYKKYAEMRGINV